MDDETRRRQLAENERRLRAVNRRIEASTTELIAEGFASGRSEAEFFCACGRPDCTALIRLAVEDYERIHREPHRFLVAPGHETPAVERVVERHDGYDVVEKLPELQED
jgi:hypothetical protein